MPDILSSAVALTLTTLGAAFLTSSATLVGAVASFFTFVIFVSSEIFPALSMLYAVIVVSPSVVIW